MSPGENTNLHLSAKDLKEKTLFILYLPREWREIIPPTDKTHVLVLPESFNSSCYSSTTLAEWARNWNPCMGLIQKPTGFSEKL